MIRFREGIWNCGQEEGPNLGYKPRHKEGYFPVPPMDKFQDLRTEMLLTLKIWASMWNASTMKWQQQARQKSICDLSRLFRWATNSCGLNTC